MSKTKNEQLSLFLVPDDGYDTYIIRPGGTDRTEAEFRTLEDARRYQHFLAHQGCGASTVIQLLHKRISGTWQVVEYPCAV